MHLVKGRRVGVIDGGTTLFLFFSVVIRAGSFGIETMFARESESRDINSKENDTVFLKNKFQFQLRRVRKVYQNIIKRYRR